MLLRSLSDPQDALALIAVLRGPLFGISDPELFAFKQAGGWFGIFGASAKFSPRTAAATKDGTAGDAVDRVANALASLDQYYRWTRIFPAGAALERILEHTGYLALAATTPGGVEAGDLVHAIDRVRQVVEDGGSLADAAGALEADAEAANEVESLPLEPGRTDVVRLMNLHKAKGLEANVVFLADPCGGFKPRVDVHIARTAERPQGWFKVEKKSEQSWASKLLGLHADWEKHEQTEKPFLAAEEDRLLYVAATRAREMLVVSRWTGGNQNTPAWGALNGFLGTAKELRIPTSAAVKPPAVLDCSAKSQANAVAAMTAAHDRARQPSWSMTSVTAEARHVAKMTAAPEAAADDATKVVVPNTHGHRGDAGMAWGTLIHGLLEHAMRHQGATREDLRRLAMWLTVEEPELRAVTEEAIDTVQSVACSPFWTEAQRSTHWEETPFTFAIANVLTTGVIDLIHERSEGWHITDYKTDGDGGAARSAGYAAQVSGYREALQACGVKVEGAAIEPVRAK